MKMQNFLLKFALTIDVFGKLNAADLPDTLSPLSPPTPRIKLTVEPHGVVLLKVTSTLSK